MYAWNKNFHYKHWKKLRVYPHFGVSLVNFHYFRHRHVPSLSLSLSRLGISEATLLENGCDSCAYV